MLQAAVDNAEFMLLNRWGYTQLDMFSNLFETEKGLSNGHNVISTLIKNSHFKKYILKREKQGYFPFNADSLVFIPYNGAKNKWKLTMQKYKY